MSFAAVISQKTGEAKTPLNLSMANIPSVSITAQNGKEIKGGTYLNTAAKALGFAKGTVEASPKRAYILKVLKQTAGY